MLTLSTVLQDTLLGLSLLFLEHREGRGTCTQPSEHTARTRSVHTRACMQYSLRAAPLSAHTLCTHITCEHPAQCPSTRAACAHTQRAHHMHTPCMLHAHTVHAALHAAPRCISCPGWWLPAQHGQQPARPHHAPLLLFDSRRRRMMSPAARRRIPQLLSCPWLLAPLPSPEGLCWDLPAPRV